MSLRPHHEIGIKDVMEPFRLCEDRERLLEKFQTPSKSVTVPCIYPCFRSLHSFVLNFPTPRKK